MRGRERTSLATSLSPFWGWHQHGLLGVEEHLLIGGSSWNPEVETCCLRKRVTAGNPVANMSGCACTGTHADTLAI